MKIIQLLAAFLLFTSICAQNTGFRKEQLKFPRVKAAYKEKWASLKTSLNQKGIDTNSFQLLIRCLKYEKQVEVWIKSKEAKSFQLFDSFDICASSGDLGPKRMEGDGQMPEGFYEVSIFNPYSNFHLSLGINYPNKSDKILGKKGKLGGDIMIHGSCVTIGCFPLTDEIIKQVYILAVEAKNAGQNAIPVHVFPFRMTEANLKKQITESENTIINEFWKNIKTGYDYFEKNKTLPKITVDEKGKYQVK